MEDKKKKYMFIIGPVVLFITLIGLTFAFFNYTRTGTANTISTGRIYFNTSQGPALTLTNVFPMTATEAGNANLDAVTVSITGDTTYVDGEEFEITLVDVENTINGKQIPINYIATYTAPTGGNIGTSNSDYFEDRNDKDATIYILNATGEVKEGKQVLVGYVDNGQIGVSGNLTIKAYIDADRIAISDTYYGNTPTPNPSASPTATPSSPTATPGVSDEYGTTDEWVDGRVVFTTSEWNSLSSNPISFKIKAESNQGIWVIEEGTIPTCQGCKFIYTETAFSATWNTTNSEPTVLTSGLSDDYMSVIESTGKDYFIGVKLNSNNQITNAYACTIKRGSPNAETPFCLEGSPNLSTSSKNAEILNSLFGPQYSVSGNNYGCSGNIGCYDAEGSFGEEDFYNDKSDVRAGKYDGECFVYFNGAINCGIRD